MFISKLSNQHRHSSKIRSLWSNFWCPLDKIPQNLSYFWNYLQLQHPWVLFSYCAKIFWHFVEVILSNINILFMKSTWCTINSQLDNKIIRQKHFWHVCLLMQHEGAHFQFKRIFVPAQKLVIFCTEIILTRKVDTIYLFGALFSTSETGFKNANLFGVDLFNILMYLHG